MHSSDCTNASTGSLSIAGCMGANERESAISAAVSLGLLTLNDGDPAGLTPCRYLKSAAG
jgi:hypothetical protein